jgi:Helix-turn-helix domain
MSAIFERDLPPTEKLVLLAMADHARDDGTGCYPSIATLSRKTSLSIRAVQKTMRGLEAAGYLISHGKSRGGRGVTTEYTITLDRGQRTLLPLSGRGRYERNGNPARHAPFPQSETPHAATSKPRMPRPKTPHGMHPNHPEPKSEPGLPELEALPWQK